MKMEVPQVDLPLEVLAWTKVTEDILNIYKQSCRLQACIFAICTEGTMKVSINLLEYEVHPNDLITLLPGTIIQFREKAEKVSLCFAGFSAKCIGHINLLTTIGSAYPKLIEQPIIPLSENISEYLKEYFALLSHASCDESFKMNSKLADLSLQTILTSVQLMYRNYSGNNHSNRKKEICRKLIQLITEHYKRSALCTVLCRSAGNLSATSEHYRKTSDGEKCIGYYCLYCHYRRQSAAKGYGYDYSGDSLFVEFPESLFLLQVLQTARRDVTAGI